MGQAIPRQHPSVVLRSHFNLVRALLAIAMIAVVGLTIAVLIVANEDNEVGSKSAAQSEPVLPARAPAPPDGTRYDGGPEEGTRGIAPAHPPVTRYDGGPEEGTRGPSASPQAPDTRYDGGPEEGTRGPGFSTD
ncbi:MAG: hypothetical protein ACRDLY_18525 [Thermoleophilaceae bacterium]